MPWRSQTARTRRIPPRRLLRAILRRAATRYADHGWDVVPGACLVGARFDCGRPGCHTVSCHPALPDWEAAAGHDRGTVRGWWRRLHHGVLLATGRAVDAVEVPAAIGRLALAKAGGPVAASPSGRWLFLVRPGSVLRQELRHRRDVVLHGPGSWIAAPPTVFPGGRRMTWVVPPQRTEWRLPEPAAVQALLLAGARAIEPAQRASSPRSSLRPAA